MFPNHFCYPRFSNSMSVFFSILLSSLVFLLAFTDSTHSLLIPNTLKKLFLLYDCLWNFHSFYGLFFSSAIQHSTNPPPPQRSWAGSPSRCILELFRFYGSSTHPLRRILLINAHPLSITAAAGTWIGKDSSFGHHYFPNCFLIYVFNWFRVSLY